MRDEYLKAGLAPANYVMAISRGKHPQSWFIRNISPGYHDLYAAMVWADKNRRDIDRARRELLGRGAAVVEFSIIRPTFDEIEGLG